LGIIVSALVTGDQNQVVPAVTLCVRSPSPPLSNRRPHLVFKPKVVHPQHSLLFSLLSSPKPPRPRPPLRPRHSHQQKEWNLKTYTTTPCSQATSAAAWPPSSSRPGARSPSGACRAWPLRIWQRPRLRGVVGGFGPFCGRKVNIGSWM
jgi:hypothetical protein